jgi:NADH-quinone oxidoreductase subunit J
MSNVAPYLLSALGAVCLYLMLPSGGPRRTVWIVLTGLVALAGLLLGWFTPYAAGLDRLAGPDGLFVFFGGAAVVSGALLISQERPVYAALWFVMVVLSVAGLLLLLGAQFVALVLIIIYAGAILVTYLFVIMLAVKAGMPEYDTRAHRPAGVCLAAFLLLAGYWMAQPAGSFVHRPYDPPAEARPKNDAERAVLVAAARREYIAEHTASLGRELFGRHVVALEASGVLLLVALAGALTIAERKIGSAGGTGAGGIVS